MPKYLNLKPTTVELSWHDLGKERVPLQRWQDFGMRPALLQKWRRTIISHFFAVFMKTPELTLFWSFTFALLYDHQIKRYICIPSMLILTAFVVRTHNRFKGRIDSLYYIFGSSGSLSYFRSIDNVPLEVIKQIKFLWFLVIRTFF